MNCQKTDDVSYPIASIAGCFFWGAANATDFGEPLSASADCHMQVGHIIATMACRYADDTKIEY